jgi:hypothetical protein
MHDLRPTHATLLLADGVPVKVVFERLGHASATIMLTVFQHVHPGRGREAADRFAALLDADRRAKYHEGFRSPDSRTPRAPDLQEHWGEAVSEGRHATYAHVCACESSAARRRRPWPNRGRIEVHQLCETFALAVCHSGDHHAAIAMPDEDEVAEVLDVRIPTPQSATTMPSALSSGRRLPAMSRAPR